jgi:RIO-like serine/threonine protein kinase
MISYDTKKIGKLIAWGSEHIVYEYDSDKVLKYSILHYIIGAKALARAEREIMMCKKYLGEYVLDTEIGVSSNGRHVVHIQRRLSGQPLMVRDLGSEKVREDFKELMERYDALVHAEGVHLDLMGSDGVLSGRLANIFVTDDNELRIIDATLLDARGIGLVGPLFHALGKFVVWRQDQIVRNFMAAC